MKSIHQFVIDQLRGCKGRWGDVAAKTGISRRTIEKIAREEIADPGIGHVEVLVHHFGGRLLTPKRPKKSSAAAHP